MNKQEANYKLLTKLFEKSSIEVEGRWSHHKLKAEGFMDLNIDRLYANSHIVTLSLAHNSVVNGDVMCDPDMEIEIDPTRKTVRAMHYQNSFAGAFTTSRGKEHLISFSSIQRPLDDFLHLWLNNLLEQGHKVNG